MLSLTSPPIHFPAPLLGNSPRTLRAYWSKPGIFALEKPPGFLAALSPFFPKGPSLENALEIRLPLKEPSSPLRVRSIFPLEPDCSGGALFSTDPTLTEHYRNAYGSYQFSFVFNLLVQANMLEDSLDCDLPIFNRPLTKPRILVSGQEKIKEEPECTKGYMRIPSLFLTNLEAKRQGFRKRSGPHAPLGFISHKQGKKAYTRFQRLERLSPYYELWEAHTSYLRPYQIRLHAKACGLKIVGESLVDNIPCVCLSELKRGRYKGLEKPLYPALALHLAFLRMSEEEAFAIPLPKPFEVMLAKIRKHS